jgi:hypothetical protein
MTERWRATMPRDLPIQYTMDVVVAVRGANGYRAEVAMCLPNTIAMDLWKKAMKAQESSVRRTGEKHD